MFGVPFSRVGLIPAHAGKTSVGCSESRRTWAHPRSRGENASRGDRPRARCGSSPLTRGKQVRASRCLARLGLIPAHAGKTMRRARIRSSMRAHPRSRGENSPLHLTPSEVQGSSPLTRGKPISCGVVGASHRLIPAHAGKTTRAVCRRRGTRAHPRSRGENLLRIPASELVKGSSPLTRGKRLTDKRSPGGVRLIPAHAGKTRSSAYRAQSS